MPPLVKKLCFSLALFAFSPIIAAHSIQTILPDSNTLQWKPLRTAPGAQYAVLTGNPEKKGYFVVRVKFPAHYTVNPHYHVIDQSETVISGTYYLGTGNKVDTNKGITLAAGSFVQIPAKAEHYGWTNDETILQISGIGPWGAIYKGAHTSPE